MTTWVASPRVLFRRLPDSIVLLAVDGDGPPTVLEGTGEELWDLLDRPRTLGELAGELADRHRADPEVVANDLRAALDDLRDRGLVEMHSP
jgi:hypothetical protein